MQGIAAKISSGAQKNRLHRQMRSLEGNPVQMLVSSGEGDQR
ncbi:MAG: hypothetical protein RML93_00275 [Anaerolineales bacterium]|nr:hypothetical protein [Anaerolineales bacterium]MDW8445706.1 hypothetical protein [Anaerolineales bacterium]